jgi:molybdate transport system substrate-binding protein
MTIPTHDGRAVEAEPKGAAHATAPPPHHPIRRGRNRAALTQRPAGAPRPRVLLVVAALLVVFALSASACGDEPSQAGERDSAQITVFASAALTEAFTELGQTFTAEYPGAEVVFNFAAAGELIAQLQQGASADVLAVADPSFMDEASSLVDSPVDFTRNKLAIAVAPGNPLEVQDLSDLARSDLTVVLGSQETSVGKQSQEMLDRAGVKVRPASLEITVKGVVTKVALGEADAGIVFASDVVAADGSIDGVAIPDEQNVIATYPIATLVASEHGADAQAFVDLVLSAEGQGILADHGFLPAP